MASAREQEYYTAVREANESVWNGINSLVALQREYTALDYGNTLDPGEGQNAGLTKVEVAAVVFDTANAFVTLLGSGHATNMAKLL